MRRSRALPGALVVAAAGNNSTWVSTFPAACPGAIGVAATDSSDSVPFWSNYGSPNVFVSAPGASVLADGLDGSTHVVDGTSIAAPYVAGLAALLFSQSPERTPAVVRTILAQTSAKVGVPAYGNDPYALCGTCTWNGAYGYGRIDAAAALTWAGPQFSLALPAPASVSVAPGKPATFGIPVSIDAGLGSSVALSVSGLPAGATASFSPASLATTGTSQLIVTTTTATPLGTYSLSITGADAETSRTVTATLAVSVPDFTVSATPASTTVTSGATATFPVAVDFVGGYTGKITLTASGAPSGATVSLSATSFLAPGTATLTVKTAATTAGGTYTLTLTGTSATKVVRKATVGLTVLAPDFSLAATPDTATVLAGQSASLDVALNTMNGFTGMIALTASGAPSGTTVTYAPSSVAAPGSTTATVKTAATTAGGTYTLTLTGTSATRLVRKATVTLTVLAPDFSVAATPDTATVLRGEAAAFELAVGTVNGFTGSVALTASGAPSGATVTFAPSSVAAPGSSTATVKTAATTPAGSYTLTITGTSAARVVRTAKVTLLVAPTGDFAMTVAPSATIKRGSFASVPVSLSGTGGFACTVALSASSLPPGMTPTWARTTLAVSGTTAVSTTMKLAVASSVAPGTYVIALNGTCGSLGHSGPLTVTVT